MHDKSVIRSINETLKELLAKSLGKESILDMQGETYVPLISSHSGRITFVTRLFKSGTDVETVRQLVGHKQIDTTIKYSRNNLTADQRKRILDEIDKGVD
jgi:site-specific recombinase XerD